MQYFTILLPLLLCSAYFAAKQIAESPNLKPKIFVLGLSKTGTTSIGDALSLFGYKRLGWKDIRSRHLVHTFIHGDISAAVEQSRYHDAFEDLPWPFLYREMAEMYPDAKFILSLRKDESTWLESLRRHMGRGDWEPGLFFYGTTGASGNLDIALLKYQNHTKAVREYFKDQPDRYAELVIDDGDANWNVLCRVAECPDGRVPSVGFPKINTAAHWKDGSMVARLHRTWMWVVARLEEQISYAYYKRQWPVFNRAIETVWHVISTIDLAASQLYFQFGVQRQESLPTI